MSVGQDPGWAANFLGSTEDSVLADRYRHLRSTFELGPEEFDKLVLSSMGKGKADEPAQSVAHDHVPCQKGVR